MKTLTVADRIIQYNHQLQFAGNLPEGFFVINPFGDENGALGVMEQFYRKYYSDQFTRRMILGINPGRHGAAVTGIPFTDTKRLQSHCGIKLPEVNTHEPSSVFVYQVIDAFGGVIDFFRAFYINSPFPLAIVRKAANGRWLNVNYYDDRGLFLALKPFMLHSLAQHAAMNINNEKAFVFGKKNALFLEQLLAEQQIFNSLVVLDHPRFIQQYKSKQAADYVLNYLNAFKS